MSAGREVGDGGDAGACGDDAGFTDFAALRLCGGPDMERALPLVKDGFGPWEPISAIFFWCDAETRHAVSAASAKVSPRRKIELAEVSGGDGLLLGYAEDLFA